MGTKQPYRTRVEDSFQERWGPIESRSRPYCFSHYTGYYEKEMGKTLWKYFFTLENLLPMDSLKEVKLFAEQLEKQFACKHEAGSDPSRHRRTVNLDPGYLSPPQPGPLHRKKLRAPDLPGGRRLRGSDSSLQEERFSVPSLDLSRLCRTSGAWVLHRSARQLHATTRQHWATGRSECV